MNAYKLAEIMEIHDGSQIWEHGLEIANMLRQQADRIAELENIVYRFMKDWTDEFKNYENDSDISEENKLRDDVFAILRKAQEK